MWVEGMNLCLRLPLNWAYSFTNMHQYLYRRVILVDYHNEDMVCLGLFR